MTKDKLFNIIENSLLRDEKPSEFLNKLKEKELLDKFPFSYLKDLEKIKQSKKHHPEGNVWIHTMMVIDEGAKYRQMANNKRELMWSLLLHDIGKIKTTKFQKGHWTAYNHDVVGEKEAIEFLDCFNCDNEFKLRVSKLIRYHMHLLYIVKYLPFTDKVGLKKYTDINDLAIVFLCDRLGRGGLTKNDIKEIELEVNNFKKKWHY